MDWWERLVNGNEPISLGLQRGVSQPEQSLRWIKEQAAKTLFLAHRHGLFDEVIAAINGKKYRVKPSENEMWKYFAQVRRKLPVLIASRGRQNDSVRPIEFHHWTQ